MAPEWGHLFVFKISFGGGSNATENRWLYL
jgi:hypothetical protein